MPRVSSVTTNPPLQKVVISVPPVQTFEDVRQVLARALEDFQSQLLAQFPVTNYEGMRISNVGVPQAADDVVTLKYLVGAQLPPQQNIVTSSPSGGGATSGLNWRTIDIKDTTVGNDIADATIIHASAAGPYTCSLVGGVLRQAITVDLTVRLNLWVSGVSSVVGTFTIPHTTAINTTVSFSTFTTSSFPDLSVLTWDITGSDGSTSSSGVASYSVWYA